MEVSHRGKAFMHVAEEAEADLRELLGIPRNYKVLFMQGGASAQFSLVPLNLSRADWVVDYINTGHWSKKAIAEARRYCAVNVAADAGGEYLRVPPQREFKLSSEPAYLHYTPNETISGVEFHYVPAGRGVPLVADMSSTILSRPVDVSKFGLIYAGAQKNIGPSGLTIVIARGDLLGHARAETPAVFNYQLVADEGSLLNTPPTFAWYVAGLVFKWLKKQGGLAADGRAQPGQGPGAVCRDRRLRALPQSRREGRALLDERHLHARADLARDRVPGAGRAPPGCTISRATAFSAACARACTTPCPWQPSRRWSASCANSSASTDESA